MYSLHDGNRIEAVPIQEEMRPLIIEGKLEPLGREFFHGQKHIYI